MALADAGYTRTEIAAKLDLLYHRVAGVLKRGGRQMPNQTAIVQSARIRALNKARGEATRVKVRDLDDQGRRRAEIAAELGLSLQCVAQVLSDAGRGINAAERIARSRATRKAQSDALRAEILALDDLGRSRQEIAAQLVRSYDHVCNVLVLAGRRSPIASKKTCAMTQVSATFPVDCDGNQSVCPTVNPVTERKHSNAHDS